MSTLDDESTAEKLALLNPHAHARPVFVFIKQIHEFSNDVNIIYLC